MDNLPPELLLRIAGHCDFADVCAISKVNRRCNEVIEMNWNSLNKTRVQKIALSECGYQKEVECVIWCKFGREKTLGIVVAQGSDDDNDVNASKLLENGWKDGWLQLRYKNEHFVSPKNLCEYLEDLLAPIFRRSNIVQLQVNDQKSSTLQVLISLLERFRPTVALLELNVGSKDGRLDHHDVQELIDSARIVELANPGRLEFSIADCFTKEDVCERFLTKIANLYIPHVTMLFSYHIDGSNINRSILHGPLPKCYVLECRGDAGMGISPLAVPDIVDLVEEWSNNKRVIVRYRFNCFPIHIKVVAAQIAKELQKRNLPIRFEVVKENEEFLIKKNAKRGGNQDQLRMTFDFNDNFHLFPETNRLFIQASQGNEA